MRTIAPIVSTLVARAPRRRLAGLLMATLLAGCSTPQPALDQANHTVKLMSTLETQLAQFRREHAAVERARLESMAMQEQVTASLSIADERDRLALQAAGDTVEEALRLKLLANADAVTALQLAAAAEQEALAARIAALLQPLPGTRSSIGAAQTEISKLGVELSREKRLEELIAFGNEVARSIRRNEQMLQAARDKAAAADEAARQAARREAGVP